MKVPMREDGKKPSFVNLTFVDDEEFRLLNWARMNDLPTGRAARKGDLTLREFAMRAMHQRARDVMKKHLASGGSVHPDVAGLVDRFRDR